MIAVVGSAPEFADPVDEALQRSESTFRSPRMLDADDTSAVDGEVYWKPVKSLWISGMTLTALIGGPLFFTWGALVLFLATTAVTVCLGHSLGMHRRLIHRSYDCPLWLERLFVYLGTLVGMAGPYGMIRQHDIRDWAQRKPRCHSYLAHRSSFLRDGFWQIHCELRLAHPPQLVMERRVAEDRFYRFIERTWMAQQIPWAVLFFAIGGVPWVVWGIAVRVAASVTGHWLVGLLRAQPGAALVACRGRRRAGLQRALLRADHHGRGLAQQSSCFPGLGAPRAARRRDRSRLVGAAWTDAHWSGVGREDARVAAAPAEPGSAAAVT